MLCMLCYMYGISDAKDEVEGCSAISATLLSF
ncbi:hypothetical protein T01_9627 [Trichinella spiralis]|uniref:Uncharacterized protein n=1 Tax=Trichinella spiralis TaxID=6334 RepID=A0A0V1AL15_TRISP|nr:hypothetical protein T01_9627 [Trichinella spiralis]